LKPGGADWRVIMGPPPPATQRRDPATETYAALRMMRN
jgi:hypothetical protein